nr:hypothetical protein [Tanacetum cinerariifolium]
VVDPTKVKVGDQEHAEEEARFLDSTVGADQGDSAAGGGQDTSTGLVTGVKIIEAENVTAEKPKRPRKKRRAFMDASDSSHSPKKLRGPYETSSEVPTSGKSTYVLKELLASSMLNVEAGVAAVTTLRMVTSLVSAMPEHEGGAPADFVTGLNLYTVGASERFVISSNSSHYSGTNASRVEDDSIIRSVVVPPVITKALVTSHAVIVLLVLETSTKICEMDYHHLFTEFNVGTTRQACLNVKVRMRTEYHLSERKRLESECGKQADLLKVKDKETENLMAQLLLKETEVVKAAHLCTQVSAAKATEKIHNNEIDALKQKNVSIKNEKRSLNGKVDARLEDIMNLLRLEGPLADALRMNDFQPNVDQLIIPDHYTEDQVVLAKRSALNGVWTPFVDPLSVENLVALLFASRIAACSFLSSKRSRLIPKASLFCTISTSAVLSLSMHIYVGMTASVPYEISSIEFLLLASSLALIPSAKLQFSLSTNPFACGCFTEAKRWRIHNFPH